MFKKLNKKAEFERYKNLYYLKSGSYVSIEYQQQGCTYIFYRYSKPEHWIGGFILNFSPLFRYLSNFNHEERLKLFANNNFCDDSLIEISGLWMYAKKTFIERLYIYLILVVKTFISNKRTIIAGSFQKGLIDFQKKVIDKTIYKGLQDVAGKKGLLEIYIVSRYDFVLNSISAIFTSFIKFKNHPRPTTKLVKYSH